MIKQNELLKAINLVLVELYPDYTVYIQECTKDFTPSSFKLELIRISTKDACCDFVEKTAYYTITCFASKDAYYRTNPEELTDIQDTILQRIQIGYIVVGDRKIKISGSTGGLDDDRAYIELQLEYFDKRTDETDTTPIATSVQTRIKEI